MEAGETSRFWSDNYLKQSLAVGWRVLFVGCLLWINENTYEVLFPWTVIKHQRQYLQSPVKPLPAWPSPRTPSWPDWSVLVVLFFKCICLGWKEWRGRCKRRRLSYDSPFSGTISCFACLEPQQNWIVAFITNRGQRLHPLVGEFLVRYSSEYFFCSGHSNHTLACSFFSDFFSS